MRHHFQTGPAARTLACCLFVLFFAGSLFGQTYNTIANGNWLSPATWEGGVVPPTATTLPAGATINIKHTVLYDTGNAVFRNEGEVRIQPAAGTTARLNLPSGIHFETLPGGKFNIINASLIQCRFGDCSNGQPYNVQNRPTQQLNSGSFRNSGGVVDVRSSIVEIAQGWSNFGTEMIVDSCLTIGEAFALKGTQSAPSNSTISRSYISFGWHGPGQFELANATVEFQEARFQSAGIDSGGFNLAIGTANGDIDYVTFRNQVGNFTANAFLYASPTLNTSGLNLDAYCVSHPSNFQHNGKITGTRFSDCGLSWFPASCSVLTPSAAGALIEGRVLTANGTGIARATVEVTGGDLPRPIRALTNGFGIFQFPDLPVGKMYVVRVSAKGHTFPESSRIVSLMDTMSDFDFVAAGDNGSVKRRPQK